MSRQIRRQIPQKQKKKRVDRNACLLVFILIFFRNTDFSSADSER